MTMMNVGDVNTVTMAGTFRAFGRKSIHALRKRIEEVM